MLFVCGPLTNVFLNVFGIVHAVSRMLSQCIFYIIIAIVVQFHLFESIKPMFANKPLLIVCNKIDVIGINELPAEKQVFPKIVQLSLFSCVKLVLVGRLVLRSFLK